METCLIHIFLFCNNSRFFSDSSLQIHLTIRWKHNYWLDGFVLSEKLGHTRKWHSKINPCLETWWCSDVCICWATAARWASASRWGFILLLMSVRLNCIYHRVSSLGLGTRWIRSLFLENWFMHISFSNNLLLWWQACAASELDHWKCLNKISLNGG